MMRKRKESYRPVAQQKGTSWVRRATGDVEDQRGVLGCGSGGSP